MGHEEETALINSLENHDPDAERASLFGRASYIGPRDNDWVKVDASIPRRTLTKEQWSAWYGLQNAADELVASFKVMPEQVKTYEQGVRDGREKQKAEDIRVLRYVIDNEFEV